MNITEEEQLKMEIAHIFESGANEIRVSEMVKSFIDSRKEASNTEIIGSVSGISFENEDLQIIKTDILHIYDKVSLSWEEVHKRNLILNKIKKQLGDDYYR